MEFGFQHLRLEGGELARGHVLVDHLLQIRVEGEGVVRWSEGNARAVLGGGGNMEKKRAAAC